MNAFIRNLAFLTLAIMAFNQALAQKASFTTNSGMSIGFGVGASYQQSDIANSRGAGFDFTLGHPICKKENAFFSLDWKFRFLAGENKAFDHRIKPDTTFDNIRLDIVNLDLEIGLTLNRLRERTRIVITGFAGAGMTYGSTFTDLYDGSGLLYNYSAINPNQERAKIYADLLKLSDGNFETPLVNRAALFPTLGIFIGYQFSPGFMLGIEHKTNFSLTEQNSWDGINFDNNIKTGSKLDRIHYTTLSLRWNLRGRSSRPTGSYTSPGINYATPANKADNTTEPITTPPPVRTVNPPVAPPVVRFINPPNPVTVDNNIFGLSVQTVNVKAWHDVTVTINGINTNNFNFSVEGVVTTNIALEEGVTKVEVTGKNESGSTTEQTTITYNRPLKIKPPVVNILIPETDPFNTCQSSQDIRAIITDIKGKENILVYINGKKSTDFTYDNNLFTLNTTIKLIEGLNEINITARNEAGQGAKSQVIVKETRPETEIRPATETKPATETRPVTETSPCPQPELRMIAPAQNDLITDNPSYTFRTEVKNIARRDQLLLTLNSKNMTSFGFNGNELISNVSLNTGSNSFILTAKNDCGAITVTSSIIYRPAEPITVKEKPCPRPGLNFSVDAVNYADATHELKGTVSNIKSRSDITMTVNGTPYDGFQFVPNAGKLGARFKFTPGTHIIMVNVSNECGQVSGSDTVIIKQPRPCPQPVLRMITPTQNDLTTDSPSYTFRTEVKNISGREQLLVTVNSKNITSFNFDGKELTYTASLSGGNNSFVLVAKNSCGNATVTSSIIYKPAEPVPVEEKPSPDLCGTRINPGNAPWEFCLVTPSGTFNRENLASIIFSHSGPASSLFIMPIAGGGDAVVNGKPYNLKPGQYYLFEGNMIVTVSTKNPGSMGQWSVCIISDKDPVFGNGSNRPKSPCEEIQDDSTSKKNIPAREDKPSRDAKKDTSKTGGKK
jgi:hypothetical protein